MHHQFHLRKPKASELRALSELCLRSKAYWGYDDAFMAACVEPLTLTERDLEYDIIVVAMDASAMAGMAQLGYVGDCMEVDMLFVDPVYIGSGCGRVLMNWCQTTALALGHSRLRIEADPGAVGFYERMGAVRIGEAPSNAIEGRMLPLLEWSLSAEIP